MSVVVDRPRGLVPTIGGSTYVKRSEMDWKPTRFEKVSIKVLYEDPERGEMTCLLKLEPGAHIPFTSTLKSSRRSSWKAASKITMEWRRPEITSGASLARCMTTRRPAEPCCSPCTANRVSIITR